MVLSKKSGPNTVDAVEHQVGGRSDDPARGFPGVDAGHARRDHALHELREQLVIAMAKGGDHLGYIGGEAFVQLADASERLW